MLVISDRSKAIKGYHMNDLLDLFPDFDFDDDEPFHDASPDVSAQSMYWDGFGCLFTTCWVVNIMTRKLGLCPLTWITLLVISVLLFCTFNLLFQNLGQKNKKHLWFLQSVHQCYCYKGIGLSIQPNYLSWKWVWNFSFFISFYLCWQYLS